MKQLLICSLFISLLFSAAPAPSAQAAEGIVHAVLFYSPSCGHCHLVITETIPPLLEKYGDQLYIVGVDVSQPDGQALFVNALQYFNQESGGVPFLVVGEHYLVGSIDIPEKFPGVIDQYLAQGGVGWPAIPGLAEAMESVPEAPTQAPQPAAQESSSPTAAASGAADPAATPTTGGLVLTGDFSADVWQRLLRDPAGNSLALIVLAGMVLSLIWAVRLLRQPSSPLPGQSWDWVIPVLCAVGLVVAGYMAYVETAQVEAVCGPVGDCNTVQQSSYARLFGVLPIGTLGLVGYVMILLAWAAARFTNQRLARYASLALLGLTGFGILFSIYLTFLEPFVIGASCAWCLTSAIIMTALFWLSLAPARLAFAARSPRLRKM